MAVAESLLKSTANTRTVLPGSLRFIRSDVPDQITPEEMTRLAQQNIRMIIDLRTAAERAKKPCILAEDDRFRYHHLPVTGDDTIPASPDDVAASYIRMVDAQMRRIITTIMNAPTNVLLFCNAGKDRTGVVSAILQKACGMQDADIVKDYVQSGENLAEQLEAYAKRDPLIDLQVILPNESYMERFLEWYAVHPFE